MRNFLGFPQLPYIGTPYIRPMTLMGQQGICVPLLFQWLSYGASTAFPNINVRVDLSPQNVQAKLKQIRSVFIDNLGSDNPVYIYFPSTSYTVVAQPNSAGWYPVFTCDMILWVIGEGFLDNDVPQSYVLVSNVQIEPYVDIELATAISLWRASPTITRGTTIYNSAFGIPALGDQMESSALLSLRNGSTPVILWGTPYSSGFIYLNSIVINLSGIGSTPAAEGILNIESTGAAGILFSPHFTANGGPPNGVVPLLQMSGMQVKLDATQTWRARDVLNIQFGSAQIISCFTHGP